MADPVKNLSAPAPAKPEPPKTGEVNPFDLNTPFAASRWLMSKGWEPMGDPQSPFCEWWDPTRSEKESTVMVEVFAPHVTGYDDKKFPIYEMKAVMVEDAHKRKVPVKQPRVTPPGHPYSTNKAMQIQLSRDKAAALAAKAAKTAAVAAA